MEEIKKVILPINQYSITKAMFNDYDIYYRIDETDYRWCINYNNFLNKKDTYIDWYIRIPLSDFFKFIEDPQSLKIENAQLKISLLLRDKQIKKEKSWDEILDEILNLITKYDSE